MYDDMTVPCGEGYLNLRVGAIIQKDGKFLMAGNRNSDYLYSVGGRIKFGETAEQAVVREVEEETGIRMAIERLGFIHENYFYADAPDKLGKVIYELSFYFYMAAPDSLPSDGQLFKEGEEEEFLKWVSPDASQNYYPGFFRTELLKPVPWVQHIVNDERQKLGSKVTVIIDRPLGSSHPDHPETIYPINYGYVPGILAGDGEEQDAYILGVAEPLSQFTGQLIATVHRRDDQEDKWVVAPWGKTFTKAEIAAAIHFQEQYFLSDLQLLEP